MLSPVGALPEWPKKKGTTTCSNGREPCLEASRFPAGKQTGRKALPATPNCGTLLLATEGTPVSTQLGRGRRADVLDGSIPGSLLQPLRNTEGACADVRQGRKDEDVSDTEAEIK